MFFRKLHSCQISSKSAIPSWLCSLVSDVEIIKECIFEAVGMLDPEKVDKYKQLPLSRRTITNRQHELAENVTTSYSCTK